MAEKIQIDITAEDDASKVIDDVADAADDLERLEPEIDVSADTDGAVRGLRDVGDEADKLLGSDVVLPVRADIDAAKADLATLRGELEQTGDKADDTARQLDRVGSSGGEGLKTRGNAIADLTGPLGDASGAASDFAGVFDGIGDIAEDVAGKVGLNAAAMSTAIGGVGIAIAAAAAVWTLFKQRQDEARQRQEELVKGQRELNKALAEGNVADAAKQLTESYKDAFTAADKLGVGVSDLTRYITGQSDSLPTLIGLQGDLQRRMDEATTGSTRQELALLLASYDGLTGTIDKARQAYTDTNGTIEEQDRRLDNVGRALTGVATDTDAATRAQQRAESQVDRTRDAFDRLRGAVNFSGELLRLQNAFDDMGDNAQQSLQDTAAEVNDLKSTIIDAAETAGASPIEVRTALEKIDQGDLAGARADAESWFARNQVNVESQLRPPSQWELLAVKSLIGATIGTIQVPVVAVPRSGNYGGG